MQRQARLHDVLAAEAAKGDQWAMNELLRQYEPLIIKTSRALVAGMESTTVEDLKQTAGLVLMEMVTAYNIEAAAFTTFAFRFMPLQIRRLADTAFQDRLVSPPAHVLRGDRSRYRDTGEAEHHLNAGISINARQSPEGGEMPADEFLAFIWPDACCDDDLGIGLLKRQVWAAVDALAPRDKTLVRMYYGAGMTLEQIGAELGKTRQAVNTALAKAIAKLQIKLGANHDHHDIEHQHPPRSLKAATRH